MDATLVTQYFGSNEELFSQAAHMPPDEELPADPAKLTELLLSIVGVKVGEASSLPLLRSMFTHPEARTRYVPRWRGDWTSSRGQPGPGRAPTCTCGAALLVSMMLGITITRNLVELDHLRDVAQDL